MPEWLENLSLVLLGLLLVWFFGWVKGQMD